MLERPIHRRIARNTILNVAGAVVPLVVSLVTVPLYLDRIGAARYGVLAVVWVVFGYFSVFDFGVTRAAGNVLAKLAHASQREREETFWTAFLLNAALGVVGGAVLFAFGRGIFREVVSAPAHLEQSAEDGFLWLALAVPALTASSLLLGALRARDQFLSANVLTALQATLMQIAPLVYAYAVGPRLDGLMAMTVLALVVSVVVAFATCWVRIPLTRIGPARAELGRRFLRYGAWVTVTGVLGPLLTVLDRVVIGAVSGAVAVARYAIPFTLVSRALIISSGLGSALFPRFSFADPADADAVADRSLRGLLVVLTPILVVATVVVDPFLRLWIGESLARHSAPVAEALLIGVWANSVADVPYAFLQGIGRPDLPAKFHLLQLIPYVVLLWLGLKTFGIVGAAWAWDFRAVLDALMLFVAAHRKRRERFATERSLVVSGAIVAAAAVTSLTAYDSWPLRIGVGAAFCAASVYASLQEVSRLRGK